MFKKSFHFSHPTTFAILSINFPILNSSELSQLAKKTIFKSTKSNYFSNSLTYHGYRYFRQPNQKETNSYSKTNKTGYHVIEILKDLYPKPQEQKNYIYTNRIIYSVALTENEIKQASQSFRRITNAGVASSFCFAAGLISIYVHPIFVLFPIWVLWNNYRAKSEIGNNHVIMIELLEADRIKFKFCWGKELIFKIREFHTNQEDDRKMLSYGGNIYVEAGYIVDKNDKVIQKLILLNDPSRILIENVSLFKDIMLSNSQEILKYQYMGRK